MPNNPINKVVFDGRTLIDLTDTTATADKIKTGYGAYGADGVWMDGTATTGGENGDVYQDEEGYIVLKPGAGTNVSVTPLSVTENGTYSAPTGVAYSPVTVDVGPARSLSDITVSGSIVSGPAGLYSEAFSKAVSAGQLEVSLSEEFVPDMFLQSATGTVLALDGGMRTRARANSGTFGYIDSTTSSARVTINWNVSASMTLPTLATTAYTPTETSQIIDRYQWLTGSQTIKAIPSSYVGTGIARRSAADLTVNGSYVNGSAGYYSQAFSKAVSTGSITFNNSLVSYDLIPQNISLLSSTGLLTISGQAATQRRPSTFSAGYFSSIPSYWVGANISGSYSLPVFGATTWTPASTNQYISSYQWLTGSQTILGDANLIASNIKSGVSIFGVTGTVPDENDLPTIYATWDDNVGEYGGYVYSCNYTYSQMVSMLGDSSLVGEFHETWDDAGTTIVTRSGGTWRIDYNINDPVFTVFNYSGNKYRYHSDGSFETIEISQSKDVMPSIYTQYVYPDYPHEYLYQVTVSGDNNLVSSNIRSGVSIFGVNGTMEGLPSSITYLPETTIVATSFMNKYPLPDLIPFNAMPVDIIINGVVYGPDRQDWIDVTYGNNVYVYKTTSKGDAFATFSFVNRDDAVCSFVENGTYTCKIVYHPFEETEYGNTLVSNRAITGTIDNIGYSYITITCDNTADKATYPYFEVTIGNVTKIIRAQDPYKYQFGNYYIDRFYYYSDSEKSISFYLYGEAESTYNFTITIKGIRKYRDTTSVVNGTGIITEPIGGSYYNVSALEYIKIDRLQEDQLVSRTLTSFTNNNITMVGTGAFYYTTRLESVYLPKVKTISQSAFYYCQALNTVSLPNCSRIDNYAFFSAFSIGASLDLPNLTSMSNYAFGYARLGTINMPLLSSIPSMCFSNCYYLTSFNAPECKFISDAAFRFCSSLTEAVLPKVSHIASYAFGNCYSLSHISAPECSSLGWSVFFSCSNLTQVYIPKVTYIGGSCFYSCSLITSLNFPSCVSIAQGAFTYCSGVTSVSLPLCETLGQSVFSRCYALSSIYLPVCTSIGTYGFANCSSLTNISIPNVSYLGASAFTYCINLSTISILKCSLFYAYTFGYCYNLLSLYLLNSSVTALSNVNAFTSTPISTYTTSTGGVNGSIFVPASLYDAYISATNWVTYSSRFVSLTDTEIAALIS